jgi:hypothetical protein
MKHIVDYLAEEIKREEATKTRKAGKHERITKLVVSLQAKAAGAGR